MVSLMGQEYFIMKMVIKNMKEVGKMIYWIRKEYSMMKLEKK